MIRKVIGGIVVGVVLFVAAKILGFPEIFQYMFFAYAMLGMLVYMLLDAPSVKPISGGKAIVVLIVFYLVLSVFYIGGASLLPQYDPEDEKGKIEKILAPKRKLTEQGKTEDLIAKVKALDEKAAALQERIKNLGKDVIQEGAAAAGCVRAGGRLVYNVCTLSPAEERLDSAGARRTWPHRDGTDGFYIAADG